MAWDDSDEPLDKYGEKVQHMTDEQEEAPECSSCHELMLLAGTEVTRAVFLHTSYSQDVRKCFPNRVLYFGCVCMSIML